jgi:hypothetical protein
VLIEKPEDHLSIGLYVEARADPSMLIHQFERPPPEHGAGGLRWSGDDLSQEEKQQYHIARGERQGKSL